MSDDVSENVRATRKLRTKAKARRRVVRGGLKLSDPLLGPKQAATNDTSNSTNMPYILDVETAKENLAVKRKSGQRKRKPLATIGTKSRFKNPLTAVAIAIGEALDPARAPSKVKSFKDMTPEEQAAIRKLYEK